MRALRVRHLRPSLGEDLWHVAEKVVVRNPVDCGPGLVKTSDGTLLAFFGTPHGTEQHAASAKEVAELGPARLLMSRSADGGASWQAPEELPSPPGLDVHYGMPSCALALPSGRILLVVRSHPHGCDRDHWFYTSHHVYRSDDGGRSWTISDPLDLAPVAGGFGYAGGELQMTGDVLTLGFQGALSEEERQAKTYSALFYRSHDEGLSWGDPSVLIRPTGHCKLAAEPSLVCLDDGRWVALVRYHGPGGGAATVRLESKDRGRSWSEPAHLFVGAMDCLRNLPGGGLLVSHVSTSGIMVRFSYDGGWTWSRELWAFDIWSEGQYRNGACWNQSLLVVDNDTILCGFTSVAPNDQHKDVYYGSREAQWGLAARIRFLRRQKDHTVSVPLEVAG